MKGLRPQTSCERRGHQDMAGKVVLTANKEKLSRCGTLLDLDDGTPGSRSLKELETEAEWSVKVDEGMRGLHLDMVLQSCYG